jgi:hypothetical protein
VVHGVSPQARETIGPLATRMTEIGPGRYTLELPLTPAPERLLPEIARTGAAIVSLNPIRETLEDFFMKRIAEAGAAARIERAGEQHARG